MKFVSHQTTLHLSFKIKCCVDRLRPPPNSGHSQYPSACLKSANKRHQPTAYRAKLGNSGGDWLRHPSRAVDLAGRRNRRGHEEAVRLAAYPTHERAATLCVMSEARAWSRFLLSAGPCSRPWAGRPRRPLQSQIAARATPNFPYLAHVANKFSERRHLKELYQINQLNESPTLVMAKNITSHIMEMPRKADHREGHRR